MKQRKYLTLSNNSNKITEEQNEKFSISSKSTGENLNAERRKSNNFRIFTEWVSSF